MCTDFSSNQVENGTKIERSHISQVIGVLIPKNFSSAMTPCACVMWFTCDLAAPVGDQEAQMAAPLVLLCFILVTFLIALPTHLTKSYRGVYFGLWFKKEQLIMMAKS